MLNFRRKLILTPILFLVVFFAFSHNVMADYIWPNIDRSYVPYIGKNNKYGYMNESSHIVIKAKFDEVDYAFHDGLAYVKINNKYGYINKNGSFSINPIYQKANVFKFGLAGVKINGKWGFINTKGNLIIKPTYEEIMIMNDSGTGIVKSNGKYGVVNKYGKLVIPCVFDGLGEFHMDGNSCKATLNGKNYDLFKDNTLYDEESKSYISLKKILDLNIKQATNTKLRSDLTTAESYASSQQYNQAINYAQQISKKNPYYKQAQKKILQWKDAMLNMKNNSNNNTYKEPESTYVAPQKNTKQ